MKKEALELELQEIMSVLDDKKLSMLVNNHLEQIAKSTSVCYYRLWRW